MIEPKDRLCPMTGKQCINNPDFPRSVCEMPNVAVEHHRVDVGKTFCHLWADKQRKDGMEKLNGQ